MVIIILNLARKCFFTAASTELLLIKLSTRWLKFAYLSVTNNSHYTKNLKPLFVILKRKQKFHFWCIADLCALDSYDMKMPLPIHCWWLKLLWNFLLLMFRLWIGKPVIYYYIWCTQQLPFELCQKNFLQSICPQQNFIT